MLSFAKILSFASQRFLSFPTNITEGTTSLIWPKSLYWLTVLDMSTLRGHNSAIIRKMMKITNNLASLCWGPPSSNLSFMDGDKTKTRRNRGYHSSDQVYLRLSEIDIFCVLISRIDEIHCHCMVWSQYWIMFRHVIKIPFPSCL